MSGKKTEAIMIRMDPVDHATLTEMCDATGITAAHMTRLALQAVLREYRLNSRIVLPLRARLTVQMGEAAVEMAHFEAAEGEQAPYGDEAPKGKRKLTPGEQAVKAAMLAKK